LVNARLTSTGACVVEAVMTIGVVLLVVALICFILAVPPLPNIPFNLIALGLVFLVLSMLLGHLTI
jgi:flagellar biosynthesis component FlhA